MTNEWVMTLKAVSFVYINTSQFVTKKNQYITITNELSQKETLTISYLK